MFQQISTACRPNRPEASLKMVDAYHLAAWYRLSLSLRRVYFK